jgi:D-glycero-alpha-D-manno-heptose-7-phosphate kinase
MVSKIEKFCTLNSSTLKEAIIKIEQNQEGFVLVENDLKQILGTLTDGDIRRALLAGAQLSDLALNYINKNFIFLDDNSMEHESIYKKLDQEITFIPVLDNKKRLLKFITKDTIPSRFEKLITVRSKSPVRISFGGGGSDTTAFFKDNDGAVINSTISLYSHCSLSKRSDSKINIDSADLNINKSYLSLDEFLNSDKCALDLIKATIKVINPSFGFDLYIQSDFPLRSGLGGSAVVVSSVIGCFNEFRIDKWSSYEIAELAYEAERLNMGISGGWQDQYATVFGGFNFMEFSNRQNLIHPLRLSETTKSSLEQNLILCYTNKSHKSSEIHQDQKSNLDNKGIQENVKKNVKIAYKMRESLLKENLNEFSNLMNDSWELKKSYSSDISSDYLDDIYEGAKQNGALSGKLLGAGGGGYFLFFTNFSNRNRLINWIKSEGLIYTNFKFEDVGLKSWIERNN